DPDAGGRARERRAGCGAAGSVRAGPGHPVPADGPGARSIPLVVSAVPAVHRVGGSDRGSVIAGAGYASPHRPVYIAGQLPARTDAVRAQEPFVIGVTS